ncbi:MAG: hypothetical protein ACLFR1_02135 [Spirochaetia bacterium]
MDWQHLLEKTKEVLGKTGSVLKGVFSSIGTAVTYAWKQIQRAVKLRPVHFVRAKILRFYLQSKIDSLGSIQAFWQPVLWVAVKVTVVVLLSIKIYSFHGAVGNWFEEVVAFFRLEEIYNFDFPSSSFFQRISRYLFLFVIAYYGLYFLYYQILAFFSALVIDTESNRAYYVKNSLLSKELYILPLPEMDMVVLKQNLIFRLFSMGSVVFHKNSGETITVSSIFMAPSAVKLLSAQKKEEPGKE